MLRHHKSYGYRVRVSKDLAFLISAVAVGELLDAQSVALPLGGEPGTL